MAAGKLIFVTGLSGSGKTTLIGHALKVVPNVRYLKTYTTRPQREDESPSVEYQFVTDAEYDAVRAASTSWDHTSFGTHKYGADTALIKSELARGANIICAVVPDASEISRMAKLYEQIPMLVVINTPGHIATERIKLDRQRASRSTNDLTQLSPDVLFEPTGELPMDIENFTLVLKRLTQ